MGGHRQCEKTDSEGEIQSDCAYKPTEHAAIGEVQTIASSGSMQRMSRGGGDSHDHGPPTTTAVAAGTKRVLRQHTPFPKLAVWSTQLSTGSVNSFAGALAGVASGIVTCPLDVIKTRLQAHGSRAFSNPDLSHAGPNASQLYRGLTGTARNILHQDGLRGFYRGLGPMLLGYMPTWAVYMVVYNDVRDHLYKQGYDKTAGSKVIAQGYSSIAGGACSTLVTNPIWVIKTRLMSQTARGTSDGSLTSWYYTSTLDAARKMYRAEGLRAFYSGLTPAMLGLTHVAIQFPLYEFLKQKFTGLEMGESPSHASGRHHHHHESNQAPGTNTLGILAATFLSKLCATTATYPHEVLRTRLQTQTRHLHPELHTNGMAANHHCQAIPRLGAGKRIGNTDGSVYMPRYRGAVQTCRMILREEGWRAFYNGLGTNMVRAIPAAMTTMLTFESVKAGLGRLREEGREILGEE